MSSNFLTSFVLLITALFSPSLANNFTFGDPLDQTLQDFAFRALTTRQGTRTGALYRAILPVNFSGIEVSIVRLTGKSLWSNGANFNNFHIPPRTLSVPPVRRVAIMFQDLGNWSSHYYNVPGYTFISSVVGFRVFDVTYMTRNPNGIREIGVRMEKSIEIHFPDLGANPDEETMSRARWCVSFAGENREFKMTPMRFPGDSCYTLTQGHFSVVVPTEKKERKKQSLLCFWAVGVVIGFGGLCSVGYLGVVAIRVLRTKKIQVMEREADEGEVFGSRWIGGSKMPSAAVTRTQPSLESRGL